MTEPDAGTVVGLLADDDRLRVVAAVALGARTADAVAEHTALDNRTVHKALERLVAAGLVEVGGDGFRIAVERLREVARAAAARRPQPPAPEDLGASPEQAGVLRHFLDGERLTHLPATRNKRLIVLDFLAGRFELGRVYTEKAVNLELGKWHRDYAALRRALVDEGFLERREGFYWRAGGSVEID